MSAKIVTLSKVDVARRQLVTAIRLLFEDGDPVSVFTLAANSWEIIDVLCRKRSVGSLSQETREHLPLGKDLKKGYVNSPFRNFFKHADKDPDAVMSGFNATQCDHLMILGVEEYLRLVGKSPIEFQVFQLWFIAIYPEKVSEEIREACRMKADQEFPSIRELERCKQVQLGAAALTRARSQPATIRDCQTELAQ